MGWRRRERSQLLQAVAVAGALSLLVTGCGGVASTSGSTAATTSGSTSASAPAKTTQVVKIGAPYPLTGDWAENGQNCVNGMELAADMINAAGGVKALNGAKVQIIPIDTSSNSPAQAESVTDQLITSDHVVALVGSYLSSLTLTSSTAAEKNKVPMVSQSYADELVQRGYHYFFKLPPLATVLGGYAVQAFVAISKDEGKTPKRVAIVGTNDASDTAQMKGVKDEAVKEGLDVTTFELYPVGVSDASPIASAVKKGNPDVIYVGGDLPDVAVVTKAIRGEGVTAPIMGPSGGGWLTYGFPKTLGKYAEGAMTSSTWNDDLSLPGVDAEAKAYEQKFGTAFEPQESGESFTAVYEIVEAINAAKSDNPQAIASELHSLTFTSGYAADMPPGKVHFAANGQDEYSIPIIIQWQSGVPRTVWPSSVATAKVIKVQ